MTVAVRTNVTAYATTHVATNMLRSLKQIIHGGELDPARLMTQWAVLENGVATWPASGHLRALVLEVFEPSDRVDDRRRRFDFTIEWEVTALEQQEPVQVGKCPDRAAEQSLC